MAVFTIIIGILLIICGVLCMFTPVATFAAVGYYIGFLLLVFGIAGIAKAFQGRSLPLEIVLSILAIIVGVLAFVRPGQIVEPGTKALGFDGILLIILSLWFIVQGIITMAMALRLKIINPFWLLSFIVGLAGILLGVYSLFHPLVMATAAGWLIGFYFIEAGADLIVLAVTAFFIKRDLRKLEKEVDEFVEEARAIDIDK